MKKILSYLAALSLLLVLVFVPGINTKAAQSRTFNLGRFESGAAVSYSLNLKLETPGSLGSYPLGSGLQLVEDSSGMLMVSGTTVGHGNISVSVSGIRCLTNSSNPSSGDVFNLVINFEILRDIPLKVTFVDGSGNQISQHNKIFKLGTGDVEWCDLYSFFTTEHVPDPLSSNPNEHYIVRNTQSVSGTGNGQFRMNGNSPQVRVAQDMMLPALNQVEYTIVCDKVTVQPYRINYLERGTNAVVFSEEGSVNTDNVWVNIRTEFHHSGSTYKISQVQNYLPTQYKYATASNAAQVYVSRADAGADGYVTYNLISYKKAGTTIASPSNASSGGSASTVSVKPRFREGWILSNNEWYYYIGGVKTNLKKGWHKDGQDGFWYYLNGADGRMLKGWNYINDEWYYLAPYTPMQTWELRSDGEWYYMHKENSRPLGSMYSNESTPDGYKVDSGGKYVK